MNKFLTKIAKAFLGLSMAIGVGVAVVGKKARDVIATSYTYAGASGSYDYWSYTTAANGGSNPTSTRLYAKNKITLSSTSKKFESVVFNFKLNANKSGKFPDSASTSSGTLTGYPTATGSNKTFTVTPAADCSEFTVTLGGTAGNIEISTFDVTFASSGPSKLETPSPSYNDTTKKVTWAAITGASNYQVKVDSGNYGDATSPYDVSGLSTGVSHTVYVVAKGDGSSYSDSDAGSVTFTPTAPKTVTGLEVLDDQANELSNGDEVSLIATGESVSADITCGVSYSSGSPDGAVTITSSPSTNFAVTTEDDETYTLTFTANGDYDVTIAATADDNYSITVTYSVSGIQIVEYQLYTGAITAGDYVIVDTGNEHCPGTTVTSNRIDNVDAPTITDNKITKPSASLVWHIAASSTYWTIQNSSTEKYLGATTTKNQGALLSEIDDHARWSLTYSDSKWVFENLGRSNDSGNPENCYLRNNGSYGWAAYSSGQGTGPSLYKKVSNDPYIEVAVTTGSTSLSVNGTATLTATLKNTTGTVTWSLVDNIPTGTGNVAQISADGNSVTVTGKKDGTVKVRAALTGCDNVDTLFTVAKALSSIAVTAAPSKTTYTEGETFSTTGMVVTATYDDGSTSTPSDYTYSPTGTLTPSDTIITISYGGESTTQAITVNAKTVKGIAVKSNPTKSSYHSGDEFNSAGLTITVTYSDESTADITSGFEISPSSYTFTSADETVGSKTFTVTYSGKEATFNVSVTKVNGVLGQGGRFYILHIGSSGYDVGVKAEANTGSSAQAAVSLPDSNSELTPFTFELSATDNKYYVSLGDDTNYLYTTTSNNGLRCGGTGKGNTWTIEKVEHSAEEIAGGEYDYYTMKYDNTSRYLTSYVTSTANDFRSYTENAGYYGIERSSNGQHGRLLLIPEGALAGEIADSLTNDLTCDNGEHAPSTSVWSSISTAFGNIKISNEKALLKNAEYTKSGSGNETVVVAKEGTTQVVAEAVAKYDYVVGLYNKGRGITAYNDFLERDSAQIGGAKLLLSNILGENPNTVIIITVISLVSVSAIGGYFFFIHKRKENI